MALAICRNGSDVFGTLLRSCKGHPDDLQGVVQAFTEQNDAMWGRWIVRRAKDSDGIWMNSVQMLFTAVSEHVDLCEFVLKCLVCEYVACSALRYASPFSIRAGQVSNSSSCGKYKNQSASVAFWVYIPAGFASAAPRVRSLLSWRALSLTMPQSLPWGSIALICYSMVLSMARMSFCAASCVCFLIWKNLNWASIFPAITRRFAE